ncbi:MAG: hypothetical protein KIG30_08325 [Eubacteriales bacterium]|nr:hypothetical protein [Eubacteriales bacterium]
MIEFISQLPTEYQEVEYIESTGTQYIDTGYYATANTKVLTDVKVLSVPARNAWIFGSRNSDVTSRYELIWINSANEYRFYYGTNNYTFSGVPSTGELAITIASTGATINGVSVTPAAATISSTNSMYIFSCHGGTASNETSYMRLFSFKIYEGNTLMHDFVPCYRKSDNAVGLYDLVNGVFYTNAGTGDFAKGKNSNAHADVVITPGGVIPIQYALRRRMMMAGGGSAPISDLPLGALINVGTDGGAGDANYEIADINNFVSGGVVLVRKNIHSKSAFGSSTTYPGGTLDNKMTSIYNSLPERLQNKIMDATFNLYSVKGAITRKVFALTYTMAGFGANNGTTEGKALQLYTSKASRIKTFNGSAAHWWLSSQRFSNYAWCVYTDGSAYGYDPSNTHGVVPAFAIPGDALYNATPNTDGSYNLIL